jgi:hypothetical protein
MKPPAIPRAPAVAMKLEAAREVARTLEQDVGQFVLDAAEGVSGAAKRLADLRTTIAAAQRDVTVMRKEQFAVMKQRADVRLEALATIMEAVATAAKAYHKYVVSTNEMVVALPTGTRLSFIALGRNGYGGSWVGNLKELIAAEAWRLIVIDDKGRAARLPFATAPELSNDDHTKLPSALALMTEAHANILRDIEAQMERLNAESMAQAGGVAA